jgi:peptidyl-prolyl cis-trans isomerase SurA
MDELAEIDDATFRAIEDLKVGDITEPKLFDDQGGVKVVKILYIVSKTEAHIANLETDYAKIQQAALADKQAELLNDWVMERKDDFYIRIAPDYKNCKFQVSWFNEKTQ